MLLGTLLCGWSCQETPVDGPASDVFTLRGEAINEDTNEPVGNALVTLNPSLSSTLTDSAGRFEFQDIATSVESYTLNIEADGYRRYVQAIATETLPEEVSIIAPLTPTATDQLSPTSPSDPFPANGARNVSTSVRFSWTSTDDSPEELRFNVYLFDRDGQTTLARGLDSSFVEVDDLSFGESYTWQVAAYDGVQDTVYGPTWQFTTTAVPGYPLAFDRIDENDNLQVFTGDVDVDPDEFYRVTSGMSQAFKPKFSPDGLNIAYLQLTGVDAYLILANADGSNATRIFNNPIPAASLNLYDFDWTPDGLALVFGYFNEVRQVDVGTRRVTNLRTFQTTDQVNEVSASPNSGTYAVNMLGNGGLRTTVLTFSTSSSATDTIMQDTLGLVSGIDFSPSGNQIVMAIDQSGQETPTLRQLDAELIEFNLINGMRFNYSTGKAAGLNDLSPEYSVDGAFIYFTRGSNRLDVEPGIYRVTRNNTNAQMVIDRGRNPTLR